ncbi:hypothetical protein [Paenibacillus caui]|uniref:hypothetical protein n=1 Tax=Paenibacillus caui TaxID=2873927 RepID=UPI001CA88D9A|nr:hypothetical protein [Paenibacillus caui]
MKRSGYLLLLFLIMSLVSLAIVSSKYIEAQNKNNELQRSIDNTFKYQLSNTLSSFSMIVNDYTYRSMLSSVATVASLSELTSYADINDDLDISLHNLFISLREDKSKDKVLLRVDEIREIFFMLVQEPTSKEATDRLSQIANETFFSIKD